MTAPPKPRYLAPSRPDRLVGQLVSALTRAGLSVAGSRILAVRGRTTGHWRTVPVNPIRVNGEHYLIAPRGQAQWVRNLRAAGAGELRLGRRTSPFTARELPDADKPAVLRAYLARWGWEIGRFVPNVAAESTDDELLAAAPGLPVFHLTLDS